MQTYQTIKARVSGETSIVIVNMTDEQYKQARDAGAKFLDEKSKEVKEFLAARKQSDAKRETETKELTDWLKATKAPKAVYERLGIRA